MIDKHTISVATCLGRVHRSIELAKKSARAGHANHEIEHHLVQAETTLSDCIRRLKKLEAILAGEKDSQ